MNVYYQDFGYSGAVFTFAKTEEEAKQYVEFDPKRIILCKKIIKGLVIETYGDS